MGIRDVCRYRRPAPHLPRNMLIGNLKHLVVPPQGYMSWLAQRAATDIGA
jgi:hypothetical protein